jgi:hypothetical protein
MPKPRNTYVRNPRFAVGASGRMAQISSAASSLHRNDRGSAAVIFYIALMANTVNDDIDERRLEALKVVGD